MCFNSIWCLLCGMFTIPHASLWFISLWIYSLSFWIPCMIINWLDLMNVLVLYTHISRETRRRLHCPANSKFEGIPSIGSIPRIQEIPIISFASRPITGLPTRMVGCTVLFQLRHWILCGNPFPVVYVEYVAALFCQTRSMVLFCTLIVWQSWKMEIMVYFMWTYIKEPRKPMTLVN